MVVNLSFFGEKTATALSSFTIPSEASRNDVIPRKFYHCHVDLSATIPTSQLYGGVILALKEVIQLRTRKYTYGASL
jgi:hypothetical protein